MTSKKIYVQLTQSSTNAAINGNNKTDGREKCSIRVPRSPNRLEALAEPCANMFMTHALNACVTVASSNG